MNGSKLIRTFFAAAGVFLVFSAAEGHAQQKKNTLVETFDNWKTYKTPSGQKKVCYALSVPTERKPEHLNRDPGYVFVSFRPSDKVMEEVAFSVGFPIREGSEAKAQIGDETFSLMTEGPNIWAKTPEDQKQLVLAMKKGATLTLSAVSRRGNTTTDSYSLKGFSKSLDRARQECR